MIPLTNHDSSEGEQWGRDQIYPDILNRQVGLSENVGLIFPMT